MDTCRGGARATASKRRLLLRRSDRRPAHAPRCSRRARRDRARCGAARSRRAPAWRAASIDSGGNVLVGEVDAATRPSGAPRRRSSACCCRAPSLSAGSRSSVPCAVSTRDAHGPRRVGRPLERRVSVIRPSASQARRARGARPGFSSTNAPIEATRPPRQELEHLAPRAALGQHPRFARIGDRARAARSRSTRAAASPSRSRRRRRRRSSRRPRWPGRRRRGGERVRVSRTSATDFSVCGGIEARRGRGRCAV